MPSEHVYGLRSQNNVIMLGDGDDKAFAGAGNDIIHAGLGSNEIYAQAAGNDIVLATGSVEPK